LSLDDNGMLVFGLDEADAWIKRLSEIAGGRAAAPDASSVPPGGLRA
jgi:hypothetical protein